MWPGTSVVLARVPRQSTKTRVCGKQEAWRGGTMIWDNPSRGASIVARKATIRVSSEINGASPREGPSGHRVSYIPKGVFAAPVGHAGGTPWKRSEPRTPTRLIPFSRGLDLRRLSDVQVGPRRAHLSPSPPPFGPRGRSRLERPWTRRGPRGAAGASGGSRCSRYLRGPRRLRGTSDRRFGGTGVVLDRRGSPPSRAYSPPASRGTSASPPRSSRSSSWSPCCPRGR
jgi:hypothetical protein